MSKVGRKRLETQNEGESEPPQKDDRGRFLAGNSGGGRQKGARNKLGEAFIEALHDDFSEHGIAAIVRVREDKPDQYLKVIASLMPKELTLNLGDERNELTDDELIERIRTLAAATFPLLEYQGGAAEQLAGVGAAPGATEPD